MRNFSIYIITDSNRRYLEVGLHHNVAVLSQELMQPTLGYCNSPLRLNRLVYAEQFKSEEEADIRKRELQLYTRMQLERMIRKGNPNWNHLQIIMPRPLAATLSLRAQ